MEVGRFFGSLHPALVHFPIVLLLVGVACDLVAFVRKQDRFAWVGMGLTLLGTAAALLAFVCGILAEVFAVRGGTPLEPMESHEWMATLTTWIFMALASFRLFMGATPKRRSLAVYLACAIGGCALLVVTAKQGGEVVYEYGANVAGAKPLHPLSAEDLATVAQHQEQTTLTYSNQMHHIFGWLVLALGLSILFERLRLGPLAKLRALMPFAFHGGGAYLFIYSDWDSWPLSKLRPVTDSEVILHKFIAVLLFAVGAAALWQRRTTHHSPLTTHEQWQWQNKLIAVTALIGGGLLFTHVHTNAPYVNNAIGVYLNHALMGTVALALAGAVLLEDAWPRLRPIALLLPVLMMTEAGLLLKYNEDLPWFLGYGEIDATAPHEGLVAHVPGGRAELLFDAKGGTLALCFFKAKSDMRNWIDTNRLEGVVEAGARKQHIQFTEQRGKDPAGSVFQAQADWLRREPMFTLRLQVPTNDGRRFVITEFDPWVTTPILPPLVGAAKVYGCPMCVDVLSSKPGACTMCGMGLVEVSRERTPRKALPLHDGQYVMELTTEPKSPSAGEMVRLQFILRKASDRTVVKDVRVVHEKRLHLFLVSKDLSWFAHEHPRQQLDGSFALDQVLPYGGDYVLLADLTPPNDRSQVFRLPLYCEGRPPSRQSLQEDDDLIHDVGDYRFSLRTTPQRLRARSEAQLTFHLEHDGKSVDDLGLFLGAVGHGIIISEDTQQFIHTHALQLTAAPPTGPDISFHAYFPKPGRYKAWAQFNHRGKIVTASFVFRAN